MTVVIGKPAKDVSEADALDYVLGYCTGNDVCTIQTANCVLELTPSILDVIQIPSDGGLAMGFL